MHSWSRIAQFQNNSRMINWFSAVGSHNSRTHKAYTTGSRSQQPDRKTANDKYNEKTKKYVKLSIDKQATYISAIYID